MPSAGNLQNKKGGCGCLLVCVGLFVGFMYWVLFTNGCARILGLETFPVKGNPRQFDPFAALPDIRSHLGAGARLTRIDADYVKSDGTMDLEATYTPAPHVTYTFQVPVKGRGDAPPVGAGDGPNTEMAQRVTVDVYQPGQTASPHHDERQHAHILRLHE